MKVNARSLFPCSALLLLFALSAFGIGSYQRTRDGKTLVWNNYPEADEAVTWSGKRDKDGYATGYGTVRLYKFKPTLVTGSNIPDRRRRSDVIGRYSGEMIQGKFEGAVVNVGADGKKSYATYVSGGRTSDWSATPAPTVAQRREKRVQAKPVVEVATKKPSPPERTPKSADQSAVTETPPQPDKSLRSLAAPPSGLRTESMAGAAPHPSPPSTTSITSTPLITSTPSIPSTPPSLSPTPGAGAGDALTVAALDTHYQAAVKNNDAETMNRILADDFVLVTGRGGTLTKADLIKAAQEKRTSYEHQEEEEGTQKVRVWGDTAVVTALLRVKGTRDGKPLDYKQWFSNTYVRTPAGWRYISGQASTPLPK
jgi:ketosteroid isomerase-like protein